MPAPQSAEITKAGPWSRKPEFGFLVAALSLGILALRWAMVLLPLGVFPVILGDDGQGPYIASVRQALAPKAAGIMRGDRVDLSTLTYSQRWRLQRPIPSSWIFARLGAAAAAASAYVDAREARARLADLEKFLASGSVPSTRAIG